MMALLCAAVCGAAYAALFWFIAARSARRRGLDPGRPPVAMFAAAAVLGVIAREHAAAAVTVTGALAAAVVDARTGYIFHDLTLAVFLAAVAELVPSGSVIDGLAAGMAFAAVLLAVFGTYYLIRRRAGMGLADVRVAACIGVGLGASYGTAAMIAAYGLGAVYGIALIVSRRARTADELRFGPFLAAGTAAAVLAQSFALDLTGAFVR